MSIYISNLIWFNILCIWSLLYAVSCLHQPSVGFGINILSVFRFLSGVLPSPSAVPLIFSLRRRKRGAWCTEKASSSTPVPRFLRVKAFWCDPTWIFVAEILRNYLMTVGAIHRREFVDKNSCVPYAASSWKILQKNMKNITKNHWYFEVQKEQKNTEVFKS